LLQFRGRRADAGKKSHASSPQGGVQIWTNSKRIDFIEIAV
jgi:hypothetical protein